MKIIKRTAKVIFNVARVYFLLVSFYLLVGLLFGTLPYAVEFTDNVTNPVADFLPAMYLIIGLVWIFVFFYKSVREQVSNLAENDSIAFLIVMVSLIFMVSSFLFWDEFGLDWWIGGVGGVGLIILVYFIGIVIKHRKREITIKRR